jgi:hypothetical protein
MQGYLAMIIPVGGGGPVDPGYGHPGADGGGKPIFHPGHPDHGLPSGPGHVSPPIWHPGHPDHGLPSSPGHPANRPPGSYPGRPDQGLPWAPGHPDAGLPVPPGITLPAPPADLASKLIVLWHVPGQTEWHGKAFEPGHPDAGLPPSEAQPKA